MKQLLQLTLSTLFIFLLSSSVHSQKHWEQISQDDGLVSNNVKLAIEENQNKLWVATDVGISLIKPHRIDNYFLPNFNLPNDKIQDIELAQNLLWIATNKGLYSFNGNSFQSYGTANGLSNTDILALATDSKDQLWIGTSSSTSMYDGQNFTHHDSVRSNDLFVDENDRVYGFRVSGLFPFRGIVKVFDSNIWVDYADSLSTSYIGGSVYEFDGKVYIMDSDSSGLDGYWEVQYPATPKFHPLEYDRITQTSTNYLKNGDLMYSTNGFQLFQASLILDYNTNQYPTLYNLRLHNDYSGSKVINSLAKSDDQLFVCTNLGLIYTSLEEKDILKYDTLATNNVISGVIANGPPFSSSAAGQSFGFGLPKSNPTYSIYAADFMFVGRESSTLNFRNTVVPFNTDWNAGPVNDVFALSQPYYIKIKKTEVEYHIANYNQPGYQMPKSIQQWPAIGDSTLGVPADLAPFVDIDQNGCYEPQNGDYPFMKGDEAIYWIRHHPDISLKMEYHYMLYAYNSSSIPELNQCQFLQCRIVNRGTELFDSAKVGFFFDGDLGNPSDDYVGFDSLNNIAYFYNGDAFDEAFQGFPGFGSNSPAVGAKFLSDSLTNGVNYNIGGGQNGDPTNPYHWWNYMNSRWGNGQPMRYGGNGFDSPSVTSDRTNIMFTGDPATNTGWTARNAGVNGTPSTPGDRRTLSSFEAFSFAPGESKVMEMVMGYGRKSNTNSHFENVPEMVRVLNIAGNYWDTLSAPQFIYGQKNDCPQAIGLSENNLLASGISIYPNPSNGILYIESEKAIDQIQVYSVSGSLLKEFQLSKNRNQMNLSDLNSGLYLLRLRGENGNWVSKKLMLQR